LRVLRGAYGGEADLLVVKNSDKLGAKQQSSTIYELLGKKM
jgi:hypothetical protein